LLPEILSGLTSTPWDQKVEYLQNVLASHIQTT